MSKHFVDLTLVALDQGVWVIDFATLREILS